MSRGVRSVGVVIAIVACGDALPVTDADGGLGPGDAGGDAVDAGDPGAVDGGDAAPRASLVTKDIVEPWRLAFAGSDLVVSSHATPGGGVFRVPATGGNAVQIGMRRAYGVAVKETNDGVCVGWGTLQYWLFDASSRPRDPSPDKAI
jgi:hypothetical protein